MIIQDSEYNNINNNNNNDDDEEKIINIQSSPEIIITETTTGEIKKTSSSLKDHKYLKQIILLFILLPFFMIPSLLFQLYLPSVFQDIAIYKYPNYNNDQIQSKASYYKSFSDALPYITVFLLGPMVGILSDKYGRKPIFFGGAILFIIDVIGVFITIKTHNLYYHYVIHTITGVSSVTNGALYSYVSDLSDEDQIPLLFSLISCISGIGIIVGPASFILINKFNNTIPNLILYIIVGSMILSCIILMFLDESLEIAKLNNKIIKQIDLTTTNPFKLVKNLFTSSSYFTWIIVLFLLITFISCDINTLFYYYNNLLYDFSPNDNSIFFGGLGIVIIIWGGVITPFLLKYYSERRIITIMLFFSSFAHILIVFSGHSKYLFMVGTALSSGSAVSLVTSIISRVTPSHLQATVLVGIQSISSIATFIASLVLNNLFMFSISDRSSSFYFPQFPFLLNGIITFITTILTIIIWKYFKNSLNSEYNLIK